MPELQPLVRKVAPLKDIEGAEDIYDFIVERSASATTPSMAQSVCSSVISMCHPKAWGDRCVRGMDLMAWIGYLSDLSEVANECRQRVYENHER